MGTPVVTINGQTYVGSKFNSETDETRPVLGSEIDYKGEKYKIMKVEHRLLSQFLHGPAADFDAGEFEECLLDGHPTRPGVIWAVWVNKV